MTKIKAVLDQETWVEVDVPDEFQAIVNSLFYSEPSISGDLNDTLGDGTTGYGEVVTNNDGSLMTDTEPRNAEQLVKMNSTEVPLQNSVEMKSALSAEANASNKVNVATTSAQSNSSNNAKERGKSTSQTLFCGDVGYHMLNWLVFFYFLSFFFLAAFRCRIFLLFLQKSWHSICF